jgi:hypothetical protein
MLYAVCFKLYAVRCTEAGLLKKLSSTGLPQISQLRYCWLRFGLASAGYRGFGVQDRPVYTAGLLTADSTELDEIPGVSLLRLLSGVSWLNFLTKTPASGVGEEESAGEDGEHGGRAGEEEKRGEDKHH